MGILTMRIDRWLVRRLAQFFFAQYGKTLRPELHKWQRFIEEDRLLHQVRALGARGYDVTFRAGVQLLAPEQIHIGDHVALGYNTILRGQGGITLEDFVVIGDNVILASAAHPMQGVYFNQTWQKPITIRQNVWITAGVIVLPGVTIGENAIIGAGAVVTEDIPPNSVAVGVPAKVIRTLDSDPAEIERQKAQIRQRRVGHALYPPFEYAD